MAELDREGPETATYPAEHEDQCEHPYCCGVHAWSGKVDSHANDCPGHRGPRLLPTGEADQR